MLKIGVVRWRGKCSRHPTFDPVSDGPGAIRGNCESCNALLDIHLCHRRMLNLMRGFAPPVDRKAIASVSDFQPTLF
jgi:hypothetical protein